MPEVERSAPSVEEAVEAALAELGVSEQEATIEVLQEPKSGLFGVAVQARDGPRPCARHGRPVHPEDEAPVQEPDEAPREPGSIVDDQADVAADFIEDLLELMGIEADVEISDAEASPTSTCGVRRATTRLGC